MRITTNRRIVARPLAVEAVMQRLEDWLALPHVHIATPSDAHFARLRMQLEHLGTAGNLHGPTPISPSSPWSADTSSIRPIFDFQRGFPGLRWANPMPIVPAPRRYRHMKAALDANRSPIKTRPAPGVSDCIVRNGSRPWSGPRRLPGRRRSQITRYTARRRT